MARRQQIERWRELAKLCSSSNGEKSEFRLGCLPCKPNSSTKSIQVQDKDVENESFASGQCLSNDSQLQIPKLKTHAGKIGRGVQNWGQDS